MRKLPCVMALLVVLGAWASSGLAADAKTFDEMLAREPFREQSHGVRFRPPLGTHLRQGSADDAVVRVQSPKPPYMIALYVRQATGSMKLADIQQRAIEQLAAVRPGAVILEQREMQLASRPGAVIYFVVPPTARDGKPWVMGQAFMPVSNTVFAVLQLDVDRDQFNAVKPVFEAVLSTLDLEDTAAMAKERAQLLRAGAEWHKNVKFEQLRQALAPEQFLRMVRDGHDVGYMMMTQAVDKQAGKDGIRVEISSRIILGEQQFDSVTRFFLSEDFKDEYWSLATTQRPVGMPVSQARGPNVYTWTETGVRDDKMILLKSEGPEGIKDSKWNLGELPDVPAEAYLSQVELHLMGRLLPRNNEKTMGFYAYYPLKSKLSFRIDRVVPSPDGTLALRSRPTPDDPEQVTQYDAAGKILTRQLGEGLKLVPTTHAELLRRWNLSGRR